MSEEWGPWIKHDGAKPIFPRHKLRLQIRYYGEGIVPQAFARITDSYPGYFWRWRRVRTGWFRSELRPVCDDPAYAPIIAYRIRRPDALRKLIDLAANPPAPNDLVLP
jgi:hypothetical protein